MGFFDDWFRPPTRKQRQRATIRENQRRGRAAEEQAMMRDRMRGWEVERTGRGHDYRRRLRDPWTNKVTRSEVVEVKSGNAKLSPLQKKTKRKSSNYRVVREDPYFF
jgi:hypothetical protein